MCSFSIHENHVHYGFKFYNNTSHYTNCLWCEVPVIQTHSFTYDLYNGLKHKLLCEECGYFKYETHVVSSSSLPNGEKICIKCFALIGSGGIQLNSIDEINYITDNGSYLSPEGIIVLSAIDAELYMSGLLNLDSLISSHGEKQ